MEIKIKAVLLQRFKTKQRATKTNVDSVAQLVEHITFNDGVLGSNPSWVTKKKVVRNDSLFLYPLLSSPAVGQKKALPKEISGKAIYCFEGKDYEIKKLFHLKINC